MKRRRFVFWLGFGLFSLSERFGFGPFDRLAAAAMRLAEPKGPSVPLDAPEHWTARENSTWHWYERENFVDGKWKLTGITTPFNKWTGEPFSGATGYLDENLVPEEMRTGDERFRAEDTSDHTLEESKHQPDPARSARHGRPPSKWLRSLHADELRIWLKTIDVPPAGVEGMTFWTHLTRDHFFDPVHIAGLTEGEQAKLHAAAHFGY